VGNTATASVTVQRVATAPLHIVSGNNQTGPIQTTLPLPLVVELQDANGVGVPNSTVVFAVAGNNGGLSAAAASGGGKPLVAVTTDANGRAQAYWTLGAHAGAGNNRVQVNSSSTSGWVIFSASGVPTAPANIVVDSGLNQTGAAGEVLPLPFIAVVVDAGNNRLANVPVTFTVTQGGGTLTGAAAQLNSASGAMLSNARDGRPLRVAPRAATPSAGAGRRSRIAPRDTAGAGNSVTMVTDGDGRAAAFLELGPDEGQSNNVVQATFYGYAGTPAVFVATGLVAGNPAQTSVTGVVLDNSSLPIPGVTMRLLTLSQGTNGNVPVDVVPPVQTDAQGQFTLTQAPVGVFKLMADGTTATVPGKQYPTLEFDVTTVAGRSTTVGMPIYLKNLDTVDQICVSATTGGTLTLPAYPGFSLTVAPGSATFPGGSLSGCITATPVNMDKIPMAPGFGQQPRFILTIQPVGTTFNPPAAITIPNVDGLAPRAVTELYSYDHDLAAFVAIGTGTVSNDGSVIASDPGVGVLKAGWHCGGNPNPSCTVCNPPACQKCVGNNPVPDPDQNGDPAPRFPDSCCWNGALIPNLNNSYDDLIAKCPNREDTGAAFDIDGCTVVGGWVGVPEANIQNPTLWLLAGFQQDNVFGTNTLFGSNVGSGGPGQTLPCNKHDVCYQTCKNDFTTCNQNFQADMDAVCATAYPSTCPYRGAQAVLCVGFVKEQLACYTASNMYGAGVTTGFGMTAYKNDQQKHCACCQ
jgi:hypothetical protein